MPKVKAVLGFILAILAMPPIFLAGLALVGWKPTCRDLKAIVQDLWRDLKVTMGNKNG